MTSILNTLFEVTVYSAVIFVFIWIFRLLLKKHVSPAMLYFAWFLLIARLLIPVTMPSGFSFFVIPAGQTEETLTQNEASPPDSDGNAETNAYVPEADGFALSAENAAQPVKNAAAETSALKETAQSGVSWETALVFLWLAGAAAMLAQTAVSSVRLKKRLKNASPIPLEWKEIAEGLKAKLDLRRGIRMVMVTGFPSPALSAGLKPVIVMPGELLSHSDETVRFALLHELTHIKRSDNIVSMLLLILRAVYWFNPVVWMAVNRMRLDMETACDNRLTKPMNGPDKKKYAGAILSMYARRQVRFALGMALGQTKKTAEQRLRGVFMRGRSSRKAKLTAILLSAALLFTCFTTACQPVTEASNSSNHLKEIIASLALSPAAASLAEAAGAPETYKDSYANEKGDVTVKIDAKIELPPVNALPAVRVNVRGFSQEQADRLAEYFLKGAPVFTEDMSVQTKEEIQQQMAFTRGQQQYEELEKQYEEAPEQRKRTPATTKLNETPDGTDLRIIAELGKDEPAVFGVSNYREYYYIFSFQNDGKGDYDSFPVTENKGELPRGMKMTREEAEASVMQCLSTLGIDDMRIESVKTATFYTDWNKMHNKDYEATAKQCYAFTLVRMVGGVPLTNISGSSQLETDDPNVPVPQQPGFDCPHDPESLDIYVDDTGIVRVEWRNPSEEAAVLSEHVALMPFDEVVKKAKENMFFKNYTAYGSTAEISITSIRLGMMRIALKDKPGEYLIVPVWDFIGDQKYSFDDHDDPEPFDQSFVTINAIDGSMIRRDWGY